MATVRRRTWSASTTTSRSRACRSTITTSRCSTIWPVLYARVAYSWRSKFLLTNRDCCFPFLPVYSLATGQMDASLFYTFNKHFKFGLEAQNLLDTTNKTTFLLNGNGLEAPRSYFKSDRSFTLSARLTF